MDISFWNNLPSPFKNNLLTSRLLPKSTTASTPPPITPQDSKPQTPKVVSSLPPPPSWAATKLAPFDLQHLIQSLHTLITAWSVHSPPPRRSPISERPRPLFRPYVAKIPWHDGVRAFLSQLFPRYGHYCGPNWSSGKESGTLLWDKRPIDWLDFCCYCHDIGYDTHDQAKLLKADLAFLECLEKPGMPTRGDARAAYLYKSMCIYGLRNILIPYRMQLVRLQGRQSLVELMGGLIGKKPFWRQS